MNAVRGQILNRLLRALPEEFIVDAGWLSRMDVTPSSTRDYLSNGWLERVASRLYRRPAAVEGTPVRWQTAVLSLQNLLGSDVHVGGLTALTLHGYAHYVAARQAPLWLYSDSRQTRALLQRLPLDADFRVRSSRLFAGATAGLETRRIDPVSSTLGAAIEPEEGSLDLRRLRISCPERAILEVLDEIPETIGFAHGRELFDGLTTLRPRLAMTLLKACISVKAKRLFLYFAREHDHAWTEAIRKSELDLGAGKRQIVSGGKLDKEFLITVPVDAGEGPARET